MINRADQEIRGHSVVRGDRLEPLFQDRQKERETRCGEHRASPTPPEGRENRDGVEKRTHTDCRCEKDIDGGNARKERNGE